MKKTKYEFIEQSVGRFGRWTTADGFTCHTDNRAAAVRFYKAHLKRINKQKT